MTDHVVFLYAEGFTVRHPSGERLIDCDVHDHLDGLVKPGLPGKYRVFLGKDGRWGFVRIGDD